MIDGDDYKTGCLLNYIYFENDYNNYYSNRFM